jgi:beta-lactamase superfamily II metal-dependent hydrolase
MRILETLLGALLFAGLATGQSAGGSLRIYSIDVEGGQSTLLAAPSGETLLIDAGWEGRRDAERIAATARRAGVRRIDALLVTHFHRDHAGGVAALASMLPIAAVYDNGANVENFKGAAELMDGYRKALSGVRRTTVRPGDKIPVGGLDITVITAGGKRIESPLAGAGAPNPVCGNEPRKADEHSENEASIGVLIRFGKFRMLDMADLLWNQEIDLMCPVNRIGTADLLIVPHHGKDTSNSATITHALHARAALMNNGETKGGSPDTFDILRRSPGLEDLWQLHYSTAAAAKNSEERLIANARGTCGGYGIDITAQPDGGFRVRNSGTGYEKTYSPVK